MSGSVELIPGLRLSPLPPPPVGTATDPAGEIAVRFAEVVATAVHPFEIAAAIEAEGVTDRQIQRSYGRQDVFELAEELFAEAQREFTEPTPVPSAWRISLTACLLRGVLYTLPVLGYVLGGRLLAGPPDRWGLPHGTLALVGSVLVSWGWDQGTSHRVHCWLGLGDRRGAARALLRGASAGVPLAFTAALLASPGGGTPVWFGVGQSLYFAAATALLLLGLDLALLVCLLPTAAGAAWVLLADPDLPVLPRVLLLLGSLVPTVLVAATALVRLAYRGPAGPLKPPAEPLLAAVPYGIFGLAVGTLTMAAGLGDRTDGTMAPHTVALTLSMGIAEWLLYAYRRRIERVLGSASSQAEFRRRASYALAGCLGGYLAILAALGCAVTMLWAGLLRPPSPLPLLGLLALGAAVWTGLMLQATGFAWLAASVCGGSALAMVAALVLRHSARDGAATEAVVCGLGAAVLAVLCARLLGEVTRHR